MSGIIHISRTRKPLHTLLRAACIAAPITALIVYSQRDPRPAPPRSVVQAAEAPVASPPAAVPALPPVTTPARMPTLAVRPDASPVATGDARREFAERNAGIDVAQLTSSQPQAARTFLNEVVLRRGDKGGFVVADVLRDSRHDHLGVRPGDVLYSLDVPGVAPVDEGSMIALTSQSDMQLDVYRNGTLVHLRLSLATPAEADRAVGQ